MRATLRLDTGDVREAVVAVVAVALAGALLGLVIPGFLLDFTNSFYSGPILIGPEEFREFLASGEGFAVMFSSDNCPSCKKMEPFWRELASEGQPVYILKLSKDTLHIFDEYGVDATPTFIAFKDGVPVALHKGVFNGPDVAGEMRSWLQAAWAAETPQEPLESLGSSYSSVSGVEVEARARPETIAALLLAGLLAGVGVAASPCTLPALAIYASTLKPGGRNTVAFALESSASAALALAAAAGLAMLAGSLLAGIQSMLIYAAAMVMVALGVAQAMGLEIFIPLSASLPRRPGLAGLAYGLIAGQCSLPLTVAVLALAAASPPEAGIVLVTGLAIGAAMPVAIVTLMASRAQRVVAGLERLRAPLGVMLALSGLAILLYEIGAI